MWQASTIVLTSWILMMTFSLSVEQDATLEASVVLRDNITIACQRFQSKVTSCYGPDESGQRIRYTNQGETLILDSVPRRNRLHVQVFTLSFNVSSLTIANVMKTDAGTYACNDGKVDYTYSVQVTDPNATVYVTKGDQSMLTCPLTSVIQNIQWNGPAGVTLYNIRGTTTLNINGLPAEFASRLAVHPRTGALIINNTQRSDDNLYKCNVGGPINYVQLTVLVSPQNPVIINTTEVIGSGRRVVRATEDSQVSLVCQVKGGYPESSVKWLRGGETGSERTENNFSQHNPDDTYDVTSTVIFLARRSEDRVTYVCQAEHRSWTSPQNASVELYLYFPPTSVSITNNREVTAGNKLSLSCTTGTSNPIAEISWKNSTNAPTGELSAILEQSGEYGGKIGYQNLTITPTRYMDGNIISCSAEDRQITVPGVHNSVILNVTYNPLAMISNGSLIHVKERDTNLTLMCVSESKPLSSFTWIKGNVTLKTTVPRSDNRDTFTIVHVNRTHYGEYSCIASNGISPNGQGNIYLSVHFKLLDYLMYFPILNYFKYPLLVQICVAPLMNCIYKYNPHKIYCYY